MKFITKTILELEKIVERLKIEEGTLLQANEEVLPQFCLRKSLQREDQRTLMDSATQYFTGLAE